MKMNARMKEKMKEVVSGYELADPRDEKMLVSDLVDAAFDVLEEHGLAK